MISLHDKANIGTNEKGTFINNYVVEFSNIMGNKDIVNITNMYVDDFYTILRKTKGISTEGKIRYNIWFEFNTIKEAENFISYCKTDFARMCLALAKISQNLSSEIKSIPWMDFKQTWTDKKLYKHFNISQEEQDFIKEVIPKYYD